MLREIWALSLLIAFMCLYSLLSFGQGFVWICDCKGCVCCSKLGVPIKTTISACVLEEALNGTVTIRPLPLGRPVNDKVSQIFNSSCRKLPIKSVAFSLNPLAPSDIHLVVF